MLEFAKFYCSYRKKLVKAFRILILWLLLWFLFASIINGFSFSLQSRLLIFLLSLFFIFEIFFLFKISRIHPFLEIKDNDGRDVHNSFTLEALSIFISAKSSGDLVKVLLKKPQIKFILQKGDFLATEVSLTQIPKESISNLAFETAKNMGGKFVTTMDIFAAYLLLTEDSTKLLFNKKLKKEELINILYWARQTMPEEENAKPIRVKLWGRGVAETWVTGWTLETSKYMVDITSDALSQKPMILGREEAFKETVMSLNKNKSVLLVGEPGSGKSALVDAIAYESFLGETGGELYHQRFYQLLADTLLAGTQNQGELENRLDSVIGEVAHSGNVIIYIPKFENILGSSTFNIDLSGALIPYLSKGTIRMVASITPGSFQRFVESRHTLLDVFDVVKLDNPDSQIALNMLLQKTSEIERKNKIAISYKAVVTAVDFAVKYLPDRVMPGAGVNLLEDTVNMVSMSSKKIVEEQDVIDKVESKTKIAVGTPQAQETNLLLNLENELSKYIIGQKEAVFAVSEALRRRRTGLESKEKPISFLFLGPTGVGKTQTAKALSHTYFGDNKMVRFDMSEYSTEDGVRRLLGGIPGTKGLTDAVSENPYSLVLLDEFEKSNPKIIDLFLQVFDDGRLTDNTGKTVSFVDSIIIATSNAASEYIREEVAKGVNVDSNFQKNLLEFLQKNGIFRPEMLNRFDGIIVFKPLTQAEVMQITKLLLLDLTKKLLEKDIAINFDEKTIAKVAKEGFDEQFGARPLRRFIQNNIEDMLAQKMLKEEIKRGDKVSLSVDQNNNLILL